MIPESVRSISESLEANKSWFVRQANALGALGASKRVREDEWSLTEVIEHLVIVERFFLSGIESAKTGKTKDPLPNKIKRKVVMFVLVNAIKVSVPNDRALPKGTDALEPLLEEWEGLGDRLKTSLGAKSEAELRFVAFNHPRAGDLTVSETLEFLNAHLIYHRKRACKVFKLKD